MTTSPRLPLRLSPVQRNELNVKRNRCIIA